MIAQPKPLSTDIAERLNNLIIADNLDELALQKIKLDIKKLLSIDSVQFYKLSGVVCFVKKDAVGLVHNFLKAIELSPNNYDVIFDFAKLLRGIGNNLLALQYARRAYQIQKTPSVLKLLIEIANATARFKESYGYFNELNKMKINAGGVDLGIIEFMDRNNLSDDDVSFVVEKAEQIAQKNNIEIKEFKTAIYYDGVEEWMSIDVLIPKKSKETVQLTCDFVDDLVVSIPEDFPISKISCGFASA